MKQSTNEIFIEGILAEKNVRQLSNGATAGDFTISVPLTIDGVQYTSLIPVNFYAAPKTKAGKDNVAFKGINTIIDKAVSIVDADGDENLADRIRVRSAQLGENIWFTPDDRLVSFARVRGNFFDRIKATDMIPSATFKNRIIISNIADEVKTIDGIATETGRLIVTGEIVQYNETIDQIQFVVQNQKYIDFVKQHWSIDDTVAASGVILYSTIETQEAEADESGFGDPQIKMVTRRIREYIITGGSLGPVEDGYEMDEIISARRERKERIQAEQEKQNDKNKSSSTDAGW